MAEDTENLVLRLLRDIRGKLDEHDGRFAKVDEQLAAIRKDVEDVRFNSTYALGLGTTTHLRTNALDERHVRFERELQEVQARLNRIEARVEP